MSKSKSFATRSAQILAGAKKASATAKVWTDLHNAIYGIGGLMSRLFTTREERERFLRSPEAAEIRSLIEALPEGPTVTAKKSDASGKILVRVPKSLHAALLAEANVESISLNQLILTKLSMQLRAMV